jgi:hypothetical protein
MRSEDEFMREQVSRAIVSAAASLRKLADDVEFQAKRLERVGTPGIPNAGTVASNVVHAVAWGTANANVSAVVTAAADYDAFRASQES